MSAPYIAPMTSLYQHCDQQKILAVPSGFRFSGRSFSAAELEFMQEMARDYGGLGVTEIARTVCELLDWKRANGKLKDLECRQLLERMQEQGWLQLPAVRARGPRGPRQILLTEASAPQTNLEASAGELEPLRWQIVDTREQSRLWTELIERHHYLGTACPWARIYAI